MPQAISAGMFGITMFDREVPTFCSATRGLNPLRASVVVVLMSGPRGHPGQCGCDPAVKERSGRPAPAGGPDPVLGSRGDPPGCGRV